MLTHERLRELLDYDPKTGLFRWRVTKGSRGRAGNVAGHFGSKGYIYIRIDKRSYLVHRLATLFMTGEWPVSQIDHIDMDPANNRWTNLRAATNAQNMMNVRRRATNTSGFKGVTWHKQARKWAAETTCDGRKHYLGLFLTPEEAHAAYCEASARLFGEFARGA